MQQRPRAHHHGWDAPAEFAVAVCIDGDRASMQVRGEIDTTTAPELHDRLDRLFADAPVDVDIDLGRVTFLDAAALSFLLSAQRRTIAVGGRFTISGRNQILPRLLEATGLTAQLTTG